MIRYILVVILTLGIVGTALWGYQEHKEKNAVLINAENNYQRAFHDLTYQVDLLHDKIGATLAMNSRKQLSPALADVWRLTSEAHTDVGQLPLSLLPFNKTEEFLSNIGNFSYRTAIRDLDKQPLSEQEYSQLKQLYKQSADIQNELRQVQHMVLKHNLRWMDVEMALANGKEASDNTIIDGFKTVEKKVGGYSEEDVNGVTSISARAKKPQFDQLPGKEISKQEAVQIAKSFSPSSNITNVKATKNGEGSEFGFYSVSFKSDGAEGNMDVTKKGGYPIWYMMNREVANQKLSLNEAYLTAQRFLKKHHFQNLEGVDSAQYDHIGVFTFVSNKNGVRIYPEALKIKVALDNGEVLGLVASDYLNHHHERQLPKPSLTAEKAKKAIHSNVKIEESRLAVISNDLNEEVLCYEFLGTLDHDTYRIYINAKTGDEEKVEKLENAEPIYNDVL
ncbi:MAG: germination protein YpeB [Bacillales bacterium]|nr:germination protein YpeB [Bacillales bacterium]